jgi:peptidoglycan L-alanyl-D-glutamate endopeptidase CwlK
MINSRELSDLLPSVKTKCLAFISGCSDAGFDVIITSTYRDNASQDALYAQGRTTPGAIVTKAKGGESFHNYRVAFDFVPIVSGKAIWNDNKLWQKCGDIGRKCGLEWGGGWGFQDKPHMQSTGGLRIEDYKAGHTYEVWKP